MMVVRNLSRLDRIVRVGAGALAVVLGLFAVGGVPGVMLALAGAVLVFSGTSGFCHVYKTFGVCTLKKPE